MFSEAVALVGGVRESRSLAPYPADAWRHFDVGATRRCNIDVDTTSIRHCVHPGLAWIHVEKAKQLSFMKKADYFTELNISLVLPACSGQTWDSNLNL